MVEGIPWEASLFLATEVERELLALWESQVNLPVFLHFLIPPTYKEPDGHGHSSGGHRSLPKPNPEGGETSSLLPRGAVSHEDGATSLLSFSPCSSNI